MKGFRAALARASARSRAELQVARRRRHPSDPARRLSHSGTAPARPSFGIAFDIDGVILRGRSPIGGSPQAIRRLYSEDGKSHSSQIILHFMKQLVGIRTQD